MKEFTEQFVKRAFKDKLDKGGNVYSRHLFTVAEELSTLPPMHQAHKNPDLIIERSVIKEIEYPIFTKITNKEDVIFFDAEPILATKD